MVDCSVLLGVRLFHIQAVLRESVLFTICLCIHCMSISSGDIAVYSLLDYVGKLFTQWNHYLKIAPCNSINEISCLSSYCLKFINLVLSDAVTTLCWNILGGSGSRVSFNKSHDDFDLCALIVKFLINDKTGNVLKMQEMGKKSNKVYQLEQRLITPSCYRYDILEL